MSYLIFCSYEVGGFPYTIADVLNKHGVDAYYVSVGEKEFGHDSRRFHYGDKAEAWDLSHAFRNRLASREIVKYLHDIKKKYHITKCLATGQKAYLLRKAGIPYKYWSFGSDLDQACFSPNWPQSYPRWKKTPIFLVFLFKTRMQARKAIRFSDAVMIAPYQKKAFEKVCGGKELFFFPHMLEVNDYEVVQQDRERMRKRICKEIQAQRFFYSSTRHFWEGTRQAMTDNKGNDVILKAFAEFLKRTGDEGSKLVLADKGPDVNASRKLASLLNIDQHIVWIKEMPREEIRKYYQGASLCFGQFGTLVLTFAAVEPLANGCITFSHFKSNLSDLPFYKDIPPILNMSDPREIARTMESILSDRNGYQNHGHESWRWAKENCSEEAFVSSFLETFKTPENL